MQDTVRKFQVRHRRERQVRHVVSRQPIRVVDMDVADLDRVHFLEAESRAPGVADLEARDVEPAALNDVHPVHLRRWLENRGVPRIGLDVEAVSPIPVLEAKHDELLAVGGGGAVARHIERTVRPVEHVNVVTRLKVHPTLRLVVVGVVVHHLLEGPPRRRERSPVGVVTVHGIDVVARGRSRGLADGRARRRICHGHIWMLARNWILTAAKLTVPICQLRGIRVQQEPKVRGGIGEPSSDDRRHIPLLESDSLIDGLAICG